MKRSFPEKPLAKYAYRFDRYNTGRYGSDRVLKAERIGIVKAADLKDAMRQAANLASPGDVLVLTHRRESE